MSGESRSKWRGRADPIAWTALAEMAGELVIVDAWIIEALAREVRERAPEPEPATIARAAGCELRPEPRLPPGVEAVLLPHGVILARPQRDARRALLVALHEVAHWLLSRRGGPHSHTDVWYLTFALLAPLPLLVALRANCGLSLDTLVDAVPAPPWALAVRLDMPTVRPAA